MSKWISHKYFYCMKIFNLDKKLNEKLFVKYLNELKRG